MFNTPRQILVAAAEQQPRGLQRIAPGALPAHHEIDPARLFPRGQQQRQQMDIARQPLRIGPQPEPFAERFRQELVAHHGLIL